MSKDQKKPAPVKQKQGFWGKFFDGLYDVLTSPFTLIFEIIAAILD